MPSGRAKRRQSAPSCDAYAAAASAEVEHLLQTQQSSLGGLSSHEARRRLEQFGFNELAKRRRRSIALQFLLKFANPLVIVLLIIAGFSFFFGDVLSALLVSSMAVISV